MAKDAPSIFLDARHRVHVENIDHCPWCGEPDTDGEFCDGGCLREFWRDAVANLAPRSARQGGSEA
jgi:hypothetical protein